MTASATSIARPPSVSEDLWAAIPEDRRDEAVAAAAAGLRRCVHPEETVRSFLRSNGISPPRERAVRQEEDEESPAKTGRKFSIRKKPATAAKSPADYSDIILRDPLTAYWAPETLSPDPNQQADIRQRAEKEIERLRVARTAGDAAAAGWIDPDDWSFHLEDA